MARRVPEILTSQPHIHPTSAGPCLLSEFLHLNSLSHTGLPWTPLESTGPLLESGWLLRGRQVVTVFPWPTKAKAKQISRKQKLSGDKLGAPKFLGTQLQPWSLSVADRTSSQVRIAFVFCILVGTLKELFTGVSLKLLFKKFLI